MHFKQNKVDLIVILSIFLVGFFIRVINLRYGIFIDEFKWIERGQSFFNALAELKPSRTFITYHPGVTAMYLTGFVQLVLPEHVDILTYVRLPFCVFGAVTCVLIYLMGKSMFNRERGIIAALLLTFEPFFIGITRIIHLDGLLSFFFTLTLYFFWRGITRQSQKYVILSGISLGFALLTKSPAVLLVPILVAWLCFLKKDTTGLLSRQSILVLLKVILIGVLTFYLLWPGIWNLTAISQKLRYLSIRYEETYKGHEHPIFFLGSLNNTAPFYFYPIMLMMRLSTGVLICFIIALVVYIHKLRKRETILKETLFLLAIVIFIIGLSMVGKKADRYLIPVWPLLVLFSSSGLKTIFNSMRAFFESISQFKNNQFVPKVVFVFAVVFPAAFWSFNYHPFYVFYFNDFVGGLKGGSFISTTYTSEGTRLVAEYLSSKSDDLVVACAYSHVTLDRFYKGEVTELPQSVTLLFERYEYVVFHLTWVQRWGYNDAIWNHFKDNNPEFAIIVQNITIIWVFAVK